MLLLIRSIIKLNTQKHRLPTFWQRGISGTIIKGSKTICFWKIAFTLWMKVLTYSIMVGWRQ